MNKEIGRRTIDRVEKIGKKAMRIGIPVAIIGTLALAGCRGVDAQKVEIIGTPTPGAAAGTPTPTETPEAAFARGAAAERAKATADKAIAEKAVAEYKAAEQAKAAAEKARIAETLRKRQVETQRLYEIYTPRPESSVYGDFFGIRFNPNTKHYDLIDVRINQRENIADHMVQPINNILTGVGNTMQVPYSLNPGEAAVEQGYFVNGEIGVFQIRINRSNNTQWFSPNITDGAVTIVPIANAAAHEADALNRAVDNNWARQNTRGEVK